MSRRPVYLDQFLDVGGSCTQLDSLDTSQEPLELGRPVTGQTGSSASISAVLGDIATITGLSGMSASSVGRILSISGANTSTNNGNFIIRSFASSTTVTVENISAVAGDANNGSILWVEREPYTLEDDLNYRRSQEKEIKGTINWYDSIATYQRPTSTSTNIDANLNNIAGNTLDAHAWILDRFQENVTVSMGSTFVTITDIGNVKHADSTDITGVPIYDGYDAGRESVCFVAIVDAKLDGYGDGSELRVLDGAHKDERIFGLTRAGSSVSPNSVEIAFYSAPIDDWDLSSISTYIWEAEQPTEINVCYGFRTRLDQFDETALRSNLIKGSLSNTGSGSSGGSVGLTEGKHRTLRHLIHFIDSGPGLGFVSGAFHETLPSGSPFPTSFIWWESSLKTGKIVELTVARDSTNKPLTEKWEMYDIDGITVLETVIDTISYSGPFEISRTRSIS